jgi:type II secretory pathway component GspD/PulD (secretin)
VHAPQAVQDEVERLIRQLDGDGSNSGSAVTVIPLTTLDPYAAAGTIRSLFAGDGDDAPVIEADSYGRRLMVRGSADQVAQVKTLLAELGEDGTGRAGGNYSSGPVRTIPLGGRDPEELLPLLQRLWETSGDAPLRVVPASPGMIIERRPLGRTNRTPAAAPATADTREAAERPAANFNVLDPVPAEDPVQADLPEKEVPAKAPSSIATEPEPGAGSPVPAADGKEPVAVTVQGGNLVVVSENDKALNRFEDLVQKLGQVIPARTKWTVFYLQTADATETAMLLEQLFPASSVSMTATDSSFMGTLTGGLSSFGSSLMDATGLDSMGLDTQTLRIIPDIRSNSLFVTGPPDKVAEVEQVLDVLDATDLPDSLRDRLPRMIDVKYADVEQVAEIVREVYKDYLQPANAAALAGNPLAMLMGGGGGGRSDRDRKDQPQGAIRLTVGVDTATSKLIVSADEALFRQIEELVHSLDDAQLQAKRTVSVVSLENADAALVQTTLGSLIPKVRTSSTAERRSQSNNSGNSSNSSSTQSGSQGSSSQPSSSGPSADDIRRMMEMRARFGGGDSGRSSFFGGGDRGGSSRGSDRSSRSSGRGR